jgi:hypothetical protein
MAADTFEIRIWIKHMWLLKTIDIPLVLMGFEPCLPQFCIGMEFKPVEVE